MVLWTLLTYYLRRLRQSADRHTIYVHDWFANVSRGPIWLLTSPKLQGKVSGGITARRFAGLHQTSHKRPLRFVQVDSMCWYIVLVHSAGTAGGGLRSTGPLQLLGPNRMQQKTLTQGLPPTTPGFSHKDSHPHPHWIHHAR